MNPARAVRKVTIRWLVTVKLYGIIPGKLQVGIMIKIVKIKGEYLTSLGPAFSLTTPSITEYVASSAACQLFFGIKKALVKVVRKRKAVNAVINKSHSDELLNEKIEYEKSFVLKLNKHARHQPHRRLPAAMTSSVIIKYTLYSCIITESSYQGPGVVAEATTVSFKCVDKTEGPEQRDSK